GSGWRSSLVIVGEGGIAAGAVGRGFAFDRRYVFYTLDKLKVICCFSAVRIDYCHGVIGDV
ncbi:hypothetical protein, partial [Pseudomonas aeruginosa]|uniref:hypothetical protein n=1 Tax=Pseudomonas aeruginosa TaxID=287 RepID=UPI0031B7C049